MGSEQKIVLLTGSGSGIGFNLALEYSLRGYKVYGLDIRFSPENSEKLEKAGVTTYVCDVTSTKELLAVKQSLVKDHGVKKIDVLYNNAGVGCTLPSTDISDDALEKTVGVNLIAPIKVVRLFHKFVVACQGTIVFTTSITLMMPVTYLACYGATKAGLDQYAKTLNMELAPLGVKVISLVTGAVDTGITSSYGIEKDSIWNTKEVHENVEYRRGIIKIEKGTEPSVYAKKAVDQLERVTTSSFRLFEGSKASYFFNLFYYTPIAPMHGFLRKRLKIDAVYPSVKKHFEEEINVVE